jgi:hypothetical protein
MNIKIGYLHCYSQWPLVKLHIVYQWRIINEKYQVNSPSSGMDIWKDPIIVTPLISKKNNCQLF